MFVFQRTLWFVGPKTAPQLWNSKILRAKTVCFRGLGFPGFAHSIQDTLFGFWCRRVFLGVWSQFFFLVNVVLGWRRSFVLLENFCEARDWRLLFRIVLIRFYHALGFVNQSIQSFFLVPNLGTLINLVNLFMGYLVCNFLWNKTWKYFYAFFLVLRRCDGFLANFTTVSGLVILIYLGCLKTGVLRRFRIISRLFLITLFLDRIRQILEMLVAAQNWIYVGEIFLRVLETLFGQDYTIRAQIFWGFSVGYLFNFFLITRALKLEVRLLKWTILIVSALL